MVRQRIFSVGAVISSLGVAVVAVPARADRTYTFDNLAVGTAVAALDGVTFSVVPQSCSNAPTLYMRVQNPTGGTSSGTRALVIDQGCPDFSSDYLQMVFAVAQERVSFTIGDYGATYQVRAYSTTDGTSGLLSTQNIVVTPGGQFVGVYRPVTVTSGSANIRRIEVQTPVGLFESIDDLRFQPDPTPPIAQITLPTTVSCVCTSVQIRGTADDPDGTYLRDRAEYRAVNSDSWTLIDQATTPVTNGLLYNWNTTGLSEGLYFVRLTVENDTELESTDTEMVYISRAFDTVSFSAPSLVGGSVCPDGTVFDNWCGTDTYWVEYAPLGSGSYNPVDPANPSYTGDRINLGLATWNTQSPAVPDGSYTLRVRAQNDCGNQASSSQFVVVDNTAPVAAITVPERCISLGTTTLVPIVGTVSDAHLGSWALQYTGGDSAGWVTIASGNTNVVSNTLGVWNTTGLRRCAYTLRLVVSDTADRDCNGAIHNTAEYDVSVDLGCEADFNRSGVVSVQDIYDYFTAWHAGCP